MTTTRLRACPVLILLMFLLPAGRISAQSGRLAITNVTVIDMASNRPKSNMTVVVEGNRVKAVGKSNAVRIPTGAQIVNGRGKFLIPGLWDMHVHILEPKLFDEYLPLLISNGVTGVRDTGTTAEGFAALPRLRREVAEGKRVGPRIVAAGRILDGAQPSVPENSVPFTTEAEARQQVRDMKAGGADFIKMYSGTPRDQYYAVIDEAKKLRIPVAGHVPFDLTSFEASDAGQVSFEHLGNIPGSCSTLDSKVINGRAEAAVKPSGKPGDFSHFPARIAISTRILLETYDNRKCQTLFAKLARNKTWQVPTLATKRSLSLVDDGKFFGDPRMKYIRSEELEDWKPENNFFLKYRTPEFIVQKRRLYQKELDLTAAMHKAGVPVIAGTDIPGAYTYPGFTLHDELALFVEIGFTPYEALKTATRNPAEFLRRSNDLGTIAKGKLADLVLLEANPLDDISNTKRINAVIANGRYFSKESREQMLAGVEALVRKK